MKPPHDEWVQGNDAGPYTSPCDKFLIHTTEGSSIEGACAAYQGGNSWPHLTVDCMFGHSYRICGHLDLDVAARSLRNESGGVQTNTDGVVQVEVVGTATNPAGIDWAWLGENVVGPICEMKNIPVISSVMWVGYPDSYGEGAPQRLSSNAWTNYRGILGHQHAPENDHGDPGLIPIGVVLEAAQPAVPAPVEIEETTMLIIRPKTSSSRYLLAYGKLVYLRSSADITEIADDADLDDPDDHPDVPSWDVSDAQWETLTRAYEVVN